MAELVWQPLNGQLGYLLDEQLRARKWKRAVMVAAFAGARGVALLLSAIAEFRTHRGEIAVYVGFDRRGTSAVALRMLLAACDQVFLVHNPDPRQIFHPKMYIFQNDDEAMVIVGSNNLTATGLYQNIEASIVVNLRLPRDQEILDTFDKQLASLPVQGVAALTEERIQELEHKGRLSHDDTETSEEGTGQEGVHEPLEGFGPQPVPPLPPMPPMPSGPRKAATTAPKIAIPRRVTVIQPKVARGVPTSASPSDVVLRWYKRLPRSDAQQVNAGTNPTGKLRISRADSGVDHTSYFREVFFAGLPWAVEPKRGGDLEVAIVPFQVTVMGKGVGTIPLRVDHAAYRVADQRNVPTVLQWGKALGATLRRRDYAGTYVVLEKLADGSYRLELTADEPSGYIT